nr:hypothetical protein [Jiangella anatolica]
MRLGLIRRHRHRRQPQLAAQGGGDVAGEQAALGGRMHPRSSRRPLERQPHQPRRVGAVHGRPARLAGADVAGRAALLRDRRQRRDEPGVAHAVHGRGEAHRDRADTAIGVAEREVLTAAAHRVRPVVRRGVVLRRRAPLDEARQACGQQERPVAPRELVEHAPDGGVLGAARRRVVGEVVLERQVDDGVGGARACREAVGVVEAAAMDGGALGRERGGGVVGAGEADHLVAVSEELVGDGRADPARSSGDEDAHGTSSRLMMSVPDIDASA